MNNKKILAGALIFILLMLLFRSSRNYRTTNKTTHPIHSQFYNSNVRNHHHLNTNLYKSHYYN